MNNINLKCADKLKILADKTRLSVLKILMEEPKHVSEINAFLGLEQSLLSHHLKLLRKAGFVEAKRDGKSVLYYFIGNTNSAVENKQIDLGCCVLSFPN